MGSGKRMYERWNLPERSHRWPLPSSFVASHDRPLSTRMICVCQVVALLPMSQRSPYLASVHLESFFGAWQFLLSFGLEFHKVLLFIKALGKLKAPLKDKRTKKMCLNLVFLGLETSIRGAKLAVKVFSHHCISFTQEQPAIWLYDFSSSNEC